MDREPPEVKHCTKQHFHEGRPNAEWLPEQLIACIQANHQAIEDDERGLAAKYWRVDLAEFLLKTPKKERHGLVFKINALQTRKRMTTKRISRVISAIGEKSRTVVSKVDGKHGSVHELR